MTGFRVFIGWDSSQAEAYDVCAFSLARHSSIALDIAPLKRDELRAAGLYRRAPDPQASTEFTYSRFLVPALAGFEGYALYCDCDFLWTADVAALAALADPHVAVQCVQHDFQPRETQKMSGQAQSVYPRKNWSSLMLFNCAHPATRTLTPERVGSEDGRALQRLYWAGDAIGALPKTWNWLEGWDAMPNGAPPNAIHFTRGGPWLADWQDTDYAALWRDERALMQ